MKYETDFVHVLGDYCVNLRGRPYWLKRPANFNHYGFAMFEKLYTGEYVIIKFIKFSKKEFKKLTEK